MEERDKLIFIEFLFTFFLLHSVIFLFGEALSGYELYLAPGLISGFYFSWFNRNRQNSFVKILIDIGIIGVLVWMIYSVGSSSWIYKDIILILVKGGIFLEIVLSFNSCSHSFLAYIQALSLPLFMGSPLFIKSYSRIHAALVIIYLICWAVILRLKFYEFFTPVWERQMKRYRSFLLASVFFLMILFISWALFNYLLLGKIQEGGVFIKEGKELIKDESLEKEYYDLQDKVQDAVAGLIYEIKTKEDRDGIIELLSSLMSGLNTMDVKKAELGLIDYLNRVGPGIEKVETEELISIIKEYVDKKILLNLKRTKEKIIYVVVRNAFNIIQRISIVNRVNKVRYAIFYPQVREHEKGLQKIITNSSVNIYAKKELTNLITELKGWKALEIYRKKMEDLKKKVESLEQPYKKEFSELVSDIEQIQSVPDFMEAKNKNEMLKYTVPPKLQGLVAEVEEILDIISDFLLPEAIKKLKKKLEESGLPIDKIKEIENALGDVKTIEDYDNFLENLLNKYGSDLKGKEFKPSQEEAAVKLKEKKLISIKIIPDYSKIPLGEERQLIAVGIYDDDSQENLTFVCDWTGTNDAIASISKGKVSTHSVGEINVYAEFQGIKSLPATVIVEDAKLLSITLTPRDSEITIKETAKLKLKAEGYYTDSSYRDLTSLVAWEYSKPRIVSVDHGNVRPLNIGKTQVLALYRGITSNPANIKVNITLEWLILFILKIISLIILGLFLVFLFLYYLTEMKKKKLKRFIKKNPREFIIKIYGNVNKILLTFGFKTEGFLPPLAYARLVEKNYSVENNVFLELTMKFAEAKYSRHILKPDDASSVLNDYNNFLKILFSRHSRLSVFFKYCLSLLHRRPHFI